jgi:hypothetical protein
MPMVMMRCASNWGQEIDTGIERTRKQGLKGLGHLVIDCPFCDFHHHLRRLYFQGDPPTEGTTDVYALDCAYGFAAEVGVIISVMALIESYLPELLVRLTGMPKAAAAITMGTFYNFSHRVDLLALIAASADTDVRRDILKLAKRIRTANNVRVKYAHAMYSVGKDENGKQTVHLVPFFGDARKPQQTIIMYDDDVAGDVETVKGIKRQIHAYLHRNERPK